MKTLIIYATKSGASEECANVLAEKLTDCTICNITKNKPDINSSDTIIIGSGVRMGNIYKPIRSFIDKNIDVLLLKKTAFYMCNAYPAILQKAIIKNIPEKLINSAICIESLGGKLPFRATNNQDWILTDNVDALVQTIKNKCL